MFQTLFISFSIALVMTAIFNFRFSAWQRPRLLLSYFALFFALEWLAEVYFIPQGALSLAVGVVCLMLALVFFAVSYGMYRLERHHEQRLAAEQVQR